MKKLIFILCAVAGLAMAQRYSVTMDEAGNISGRDALISVNGLGTKAEIAAESNRISQVEAKFQIDSVATNGVTIAATTGGAITDTGIPIENFQWQAGVTNVSQLAAFVASGDQPNAYPKLDENGKIKTNAIPVITVYFTGDWVTGD